MPLGTLIRDQRTAQKKNMFSRFRAAFNMHRYVVRKNLRVQARYIENLSLSKVSLSL